MTHLDLSASEDMRGNGRARKTPSTHVHRFERVLSCVLFCSEHDSNACNRCDPATSIAPIAPVGLAAAPLPSPLRADSAESSPIASPVSETNVEAIRSRIIARALAADEAGDHERAQQWLATLATLGSPASNTAPLAPVSTPSNVIPMRRKGGVR